MNINIVFYNFVGGILLFCLLVLFFEGLIELIFDFLRLFLACGDLFCLFLRGDFFIFSSSFFGNLGSSQFPLGEFKPVTNKLGKRVVQFISGIWGALQYLLFEPESKSTEERFSNRLGEE